MGGINDFQKWCNIGEVESGTPDDLITGDAFTDRKLWETFLMYTEIWQGGFLFPLFSAFIVSSCLVLAKAIMTLLLYPQLLKFWVIIWRCLGVKPLQSYFLKKIFDANLSLMRKTLMVCYHFMFKTTSVQLKLTSSKDCYWRTTSITTLIFVFLK